MISYDEQIYKKKYFKYKMKYLSLKGGENSKPSSRSPSKPSSTSPSKPSSTNIEPTIKIVKDNEIIYTNGDIYNGEIKDGKANGKGKKIVGFMNWFLSNLPRVTPDKIMMKIKKNLASIKH